MTSNLILFLTSHSCAVLLCTSSGYKQQWQSREIDKKKAISWSVLWINWSKHGLHVALYNLQPVIPLDHRENGVDFEKNDPGVKTIVRNIVVESQETSTVW